MKKGHRVTHCTLLAFVVYIAISSIPAQATDLRPICARLLGGLAKAAKNTAVFSLYTAPKTILSPLYYPVLAANQVELELRQAKKEGRAPTIKSIAFSVAKKTKWRGAAFAGLTTLAYFTSTSFREFERATADFDKAEVPGRTIVLDAFTKDDVLYPRAGTYVYHHKYENDPKAELIQNDVLFGSTDFEDLARNIVSKGDFSRIGKLDEFGHGDVAYTFGVYWDPEGARRRFSWVKHKDGRTFSPSDLFAPGAQIRINSCFVGNGTIGKEYADLFGEVYLRKGGTMYLSGLQMIANPAEYAAVRFNIPPPANWVRDLAEPMRTPLALWTSAEILRAQGRIKFPANKVVIVKVPPVAKRWSAKPLNAALSEIDADLNRFDNLRLNLETQVYRKVHPLIIEVMQQGLGAGRWDSHRGEMFMEDNDSDRISKLRTYLEKAHPELKLNQEKSNAKVLFYRTEGFENVSNQFKAVQKKISDLSQSLGERNSPQEGRWLQLAKDELEARVRAGELTEDEAKESEANAVAKLHLARKQLEAYHRDLEHGSYHPEQ